MTSRSVILNDDRVPGIGWNWFRGRNWIRNVQHCGIGCILDELHVKSIEKNVIRVLIFLFSFLLLDINKTWIIVWISNVWKRIKNQCIQFFPFVFFVLREKKGKKYIYYFNFFSLSSGFYFVSHTPNNVKCLFIPTQGWFYTLFTHSFKVYQTSHQSLREGTLFLCLHLTESSDKND